MILNKVREKNGGKNITLDACKRFYKLTRPLGRKQQLNRAKRTRSAYQAT